MTTLLMLAAAALAPAPVAAGSPATEVFTLSQRDHTWTATGAFDAAGSWETYRRVLGGLESPVAFSGTLFTTLTGTGGTMNLRLFVEFNGVQEQDLCTATGGTGAYAAVTGHGTWTQIGRGVDAVLVCTALVQTP